MPDTYTVSSRTARLIGEGQVREIEGRAGVDCIEGLHAARRELLQTLAPLKALYGSFGTHDDRRKQLVEAMKVRAMNRAKDAGEKYTDKSVDAEAHNDPDYLAFLDRSELERIEFIQQANQLTEIEELIRSREIELQYATAELRLSR
jgi:hypothetical protein